MPGSRGAGRRSLHPEDDNGGRSFKERHQDRLICPEYGKEMAKGSLVMHRQTQHGVAKGGSGLAGDKADGGDEPNEGVIES